MSTWILNFFSILNDIEIWYKNDSFCNLKWDCLHNLNHMQKSNFKLYVKSFVRYYTFLYYCLHTFTQSPVTKYSFRDIERIITYHFSNYYPCYNYYVVTHMLVSTVLYRKWLFRTSKCNSLVLSSSSTVLYAAVPYWDKDI